jgi:hypothetical protein
MYINKKQNKHIVSMYMFNKWKKKIKHVKQILVIFCGNFYIQMSYF